MQTRPDVEDREVLSALASWWAIEVPRIDFVPKGFGSYHWSADGYFLTVDDLGTKPWLGEDPESVFAGLERAYGTARRLREDAGLTSVVAPLATRSGAPLARLNMRFALSVFPMVTGEGGIWGEEISPAERVRLAHTLADVHRATPMVLDDAPRRPIGIPGRSALEAALAAVASPWFGGPLAEAAREDLGMHVASVTGWLGRFDALTPAVGALPIVVTHGEPHPGNLIRSSDHLHIVDWDTVALAPAERDMWMLDDGAAVEAYTARAGSALDASAVELYRLGWVLADIAAFVRLLRGPHERNPDTEKALRGLRISLSEGGTRHRPPWRVG